MATKLLFRASEHKYDRNNFHTYCDDKGPTITIIHNEYDHIYGGYVSVSWTSTDGDRIKDPTAFLFTVRPKVGYIPFNRGMESNAAIWIGDRYGPMFGEGADIAVADKCNVGDSFVFRWSFDFKERDVSGTNEVCFTVKDYEVFNISTL